jgi:hypothetical protein
MMFDIPYLADWTKIGDFMQRQTDCNTARENKSPVLIGITRLVMRFCYGKIVYSANQKIHLKKNLGGLNTEQAQNALMLGE